MDKLRGFILSKSCFVRSVDGNQVFDFLISTFKNHKLSLFFVDVTIRKKIDSKNSQFVRFLSGNKVKINATEEQIIKSKITQETKSKND